MAAISGEAKAALVERWESSCGTLAIEVQRVNGGRGRHYFTVDLLRGRRIYDSRIARTEDDARSRIDHAVRWAKVHGTSTYHRSFRAASAPASRASAGASYSSRPRKTWAVSLALFLIERTGSEDGRWSGKLDAEEQRALFGRFLGRGEICIDGERKCLLHRAQMLFAPGSRVTASLRWDAL